jgi:peptidoglycan/xylan/chitin deacetylase (PgdA/CDA1 family)
MNLISRQPLQYRVAKVWLMAHRTLQRIGKANPASGFRILLFHHVTPGQMAAFERLLRYLLDQHRILTPAEAEAMLSGQPGHAGNGRIPYLLTFDDGFLSHAGIAKDILDPLGIKGIFFVCPGLIDTPREQDRETIAISIWDGAMTSNDLPDDIGLMSWSEVESLSASGHTIGSHGYTHRRLAGLSGNDLEQEVVGAGIRLAERLGVPPDWFAYPFGNLPSVDQRAIDAIAKRYRYCCSGIRGLNSMRVNPFALYREQLGLQEPFAYQQLVVEGGLDFYYGSRTKRLRGLANMATAQTVTPDIRA